MAVTASTLRDLLDLDQDATTADILQATRAALGVEYVTVPDVHLMSVGMEWPTMPVPATVTLENLVDIMVAANEDPLIRAPRVKLGHERIQVTADGCRELGDYDPAWQGEPAFGTVRNLRLTNDGARLIGDLVEVPAWLADAAPSGWPNRSCEWVWQVVTEGGKSYSAVMTAVALLGVQQQAIKNLTDLQRLLVEGPADL
jgi:hypothetical protein